LNLTSRVQGEALVELLGMASIIDNSRGRRSRHTNAVDIDEFKSVNDSLGHPAVDELLKAVASRLQSCVRATDFVARLGCDEFAIVQIGIEQPSDVVELVKRIYAAIREPYDCLGHQIATDARLHCLR